MADEKKIHNYEKDDLLARPTPILKVKAHIDLAQDTNHHNLKDLHNKHQHHYHCSVKFAL